MKTVKEYMNMTYAMTLVEDREEGGYTLSFPDLPGCATCGETIAEVMKNGADARKAWLAAALEGPPHSRTAGGPLFRPIQTSNPPEPPPLPGGARQKGRETMNQYCLCLLSRQVL